MLWILAPFGNADEDVSPTQAAPWHTQRSF